MCGLKDLSTDDLLELASRFRLQGWMVLLSAEPFGNGNVNDTFLLNSDTGHSLHPPAHQPRCVQGSRLPDG